MTKTIDDQDIIFKIITHKKCKIKNNGNMSRVYVDNMILEMPTQLSNKLSELNKSKKFRLIKNMISQYLRMIDKNF